MTVTLPALAPLLRRGVSNLNIGANRGVAPPDDTWDVLHAKGFTHGRLAVDMAKISGAATPAVQHATLARLDAAVALLVGKGWAVSLCPFGGGTLPNVDAIHEALATLVPRYRHYPATQVGYEIRNEPHAWTADQWNVALGTLVPFVRSMAPDHTIIVPPVLHDSVEQLRFLTLIDDPNIVYTAHFYEPAQLTQQGQNGTPINPLYVFPAPAGTPGSTGLYTRAKLAQRLAIGANWAAQHNVAFMFGEIGVASDAPRTQRLAWYDATIRTIEGFGEDVVGWSVWDVDGRKFGLRPHNLAGAWDQDLVDTIVAAMSVP